MCTSNKAFDNIESQVDQNMGSSDPNYKSCEKTFDDIRTIPATFNTQQTTKGRLKLDNYCMVLSVNLLNE